ncbi:hypothetical protein ACLB9Y_10310 [Chryseobacterium scophthalmum]|uniref:hypothetical protein n=1 Tax=Chryseobacterium scophthalmum TaxID=59733 RepID=UPI00398A59B0
MPVGKYEMSDKPDVIYTTSDGKIIGIEITECIYNQIYKGNREFQTKFNNDVIVQLESKLPFKFILDIELNNEFKIKQSSRKRVINELVEFCIKEFSSITSYIPIYFENLHIDLNEIDVQNINQILAAGYRNLPIEISNICLTRNDDIGNSTHSEIAFVMVPDFTDEYLNKILEKKNSALKNYKPCDEQWLLIIEDWDLYSYFKEINISDNIITDFNKVFMYRRLTSEVINIK